MPSIYRRMQKNIVLFLLKQMFIKLSISKPAPEALTRKNVKITDLVICSKVWLHKNCLYLLQLWSILVYISICQSTDSVNAIKPTERSEEILGFFMTNVDSSFLVRRAGLIWNAQLARRSGLLKWYTRWYIKWCIKDIERNYIEQSRYCFDTTT